MVSIRRLHVHLVGVHPDALELPLGQKLKTAENVTILQDYQVVEVQGNSYAEQVLVAVGEGAKAALSAYDYLLPLL